jgi:hypothetical protein
MSVPRGRGKMMKTRYFRAIYIDLENISPETDLRLLLEEIALKSDDEELTNVYAIKLACGDSNSIKNFREQLLQLNFDIRETPHLSKSSKKNRADLIISIEAFESLYQKNPATAQSICITSAADVTVVMDKLRKYGREVWLVTKKSDAERPIFNSACDAVLVLEDYRKGRERESNDSGGKKWEFLSDLGFTREAASPIKLVLESFPKAEWHPFSSFGNKIRNTYKAFTYRGKKLNSQTKLFKELRDRKIVEIRKSDGADQFRVE